MRRCIPLLFLLLSTRSLFPAPGDAPGSGCISCHPEMPPEKGGDNHPGTNRCVSCHPAGRSECRDPSAPGIPGRVVCLGCHSGILRESAGLHAPAARSCSLCHSLHHPVGPALLNRTQTCTGCHEITKLQRVHRDQISERTSCIICHDAHGSPFKHMLRGSFEHAPFLSGDCASCHREPFKGHIRLRSSREKLCFSCHPEMLPAAGKSSHPALDPLRNRRSCLACHDPHLGKNPGLLRTSIPELCGNCHPRILRDARSAFGHQPAARNCLSCHAAHFSGLPHLLKKEVPGLCLHCHAPDDDLRNTHLGAAMEKLNCMECHTPHGSSRPFLPAPEIHAVMLRGCSECHAGSFDQLKGSRDSSCLRCHDDVVETAEKSPFFHPAVNMVSCLACHTPHASSHPHLLRDRGGGVCFQCHPNIRAGKGEVEHGIIALAGCGACHAPHGADRPHLLRDDTDVLCLGCHDARKAPGRGVRGKLLYLDRIELNATTARRMALLKLSKDATRNHPVAGHRVRGKASPEELRRHEARFTGELHCISCHDPHKGKSALLLRWGATGAFEACANCHKK